MLIDATPISSTYDDVFCENYNSDVFARSPWNCQTPPNQVLIGLSLFLTIFIMAPIISSVYDDAIKPYSDGEISFDAALIEAEAPVNHLLNQTRKQTLPCLLSCK